MQTASDVVGLDSAIVLHPEVWKKAGHVDNFTDPLVECKSCHHRFRVDKIIEDKGMTINTKLAPDTTQAWVQELKEKLSKTGFKCTHCGKDEFTDPRAFNLLMTTSAGELPTYLRPETAQGIFINFNLVKTSSRKKIPFGIGQIGKAFRNEISPRDFLFRVREFDQMELEYFTHPNLAHLAYEEYVKKCVDFLKHQLGLPEDMIRLKVYDEAELAHYAQATTDIEFKFPFGWGELWGIAHRGDFDLRQHNLGTCPFDDLSSQAKAQLKADGATESDPFIPHVIEPSVGLDRLFLAALSAGWRNELIPTSSGSASSGSDGGNTRTLLKLHPDIAPYKFAVLPLRGSMPEMIELTHTLVSKIADFGEDVDTDFSGNIGRRYRRQDEIGTPYVITIDQETLTNQSITIRDRDTMSQIRMDINQLLTHIRCRDPLPAFSNMTSGQQE